MIDKLVASQDKFVVDHHGNEGRKQREAFAKLGLAELEALHAMCSDGLTRARLRVAASDKGTPEGKAAYERMAHGYYRKEDES